MFTTTIAFITVNRILIKDHRKVALMNVEKIKLLIDKIPEIKKNFYKENIFAFRTSNLRAGTCTNSFMEEEKINKNLAFMAWRDELLSELAQLVQNDFIREIVEQLDKFNGIRDRERFESIESKLSILKENIKDYVPSASDIDLKDKYIPEKDLITVVTRILLKMQRNNHYDMNCDENTMNDYVRDLLGENYQTKDQTRQGVSENGEDAGEIDIQLLHEDLPIVMIEGIILAAVKKKELHSHINKVLNHYDPNGCPYAILLIYYKGKNLKDFHNRMIKDLNSSNYEFPFKPITQLEKIDTGYSELKHAQIVLNRNGQKLRTHIFALNIRN